MRLYVWYLVQGLKYLFKNICTNIYIYQFDWKISSPSKIDNLSHGEIVLCFWSFEFNLQHVLVQIVGAVASIANRTESIDVTRCQKYKNDFRFRFSVRKTKIEIESNKYFPSIPCHFQWCFPFFVLFSLYTYTPIRFNISLRASFIFTLFFLLRKFNFNNKKRKQIKKIHKQEYEKKKKKKKW